MKSKLTYNPDYVVPPGETLKENLVFKRITQKQLAQRLGCSTKYLRRYLRGEIRLPAGWSMVFGELFSISPKLWRLLDKHYWDGLKQGAKKL